MVRLVAERADALPALAEVFREHGYGATSLSLITAATGLGKGSLYHFFPGGKQEMASAVLADIEQWFATNVFAPLEDTIEPTQAITSMFDAVERYFHSGQRICLVGAIALGDGRDQFNTQIRGYFARWIAALTGALTKSGRDRRPATALAEETVAGIQGAIVLARALDDPSAFGRTVAKLRAGLAAT
ncbi:MAG: TetR family transcriptional regulator [Pseudonocardiales bacterium]|nr:MAG: TetR family transcriptional regulator [Pseudonocardiales bacterium]